MGVTLGVTLGSNLCADAPPAAASTPDAIITGGARKAWFRADQGITLNGANVSGWSNIWGNGDLAQAAAATQPVYDSAAISGRPALTNDGTRGMVGTLTSGIANGQRMYLWMMLKPGAVAGGTRYFGGAGLIAGSYAYLGMLANANWRAVAKGGVAIAADTGIPAVAGRTTLLEEGATASGTATFVASGVAVNTADIGAFGSVQTNVVLFGLDTVSSGAVGSVAEFVIMEGEPTAQQRLDMRAYFLARYGSI